MRYLILAVIFASTTVQAVVNDVKPDFTGVWLMDSWSADVWPVEPPYTPAGRAAQDALLADPESDPTHQCIFQLIRIISGPMPHEVIHQKNKIIILYENEHQVRRIWMDGRDHPKDGMKTLMGHSIGKWQGNTLVIDTVNIEAGYLRPQGYPHTENLHVIEKHTPIGDGNKKRIEITIDDPEYYREAWTVEMVVSRIDGEIMDYNCRVREHLPPPSQ